MKSMSKYSFILLLVILTSCDKNKNIESLATSNFSVLILKDFNPQSTTKLYNDRIIMYNSRDFVEVIDYSKVLGVHINEFSGVLDTIRIKHTKPIMQVDINYSALIQNTYYLRVGDTIIIDFSDLGDISENYTNKGKVFGDIQKTYVKDTLLFVPDF